MAIVWNIEITNVDVVSKRADISFIRTNDITQETEIYSFSNTVIGTIDERIALLDLVWDEHLKTITMQVGIDAFITDLEQSAKSNLEAREI